MNVKRRPLGSLVREPIRNGKSAQTDPESKGVRVFTLTAVTKADFGEQNTKRSVLSDEDVQGIWAEPDDIFIQRSNTPELVGTAAIYNGPRGFAVYPDLLTRVRTNDSLRPRYLVLYLRSSWVRQYFQTNARGISGSMPKVSHQTINELPVPVPSLPEQDRIVAAIEAHFSRLDAAEQGLKRVQAKLKHARASVLKAAVEGRLVPSEAALARAEGRRYEPASALLARVLVERRARWAERGERGKYKEPVAPETEGLPELPEGWALGTVDAVCANIVDCPHSTPERVPSGRLCARTTQFRPGFLDLSEPEFVTEATYYERISRLKPEPGDVLYSREGGILGIACAVPNGVELCLGQRMMLMRASGVIYSRYLMLVLNSSMTLSVVRRLISGSAAPHINVRDIRAFVVPLPPLAEQARIVAEVDRRLSVLDQVEALVGRSLTRCASLRQSILKRAFEGRLVPPSAEVTPE
ncbi:restriction endonuclease subunit S [Myxococcota bacterium]|nr:restriction endonuclease subunit S [Myxococcota bacterium]